MHPRALDALVFLTLAAVTLANVYYYFYWLADDSYISIRYALNLLNHGEIFYNRHELETGLVQGYSNPGMIPIYLLILKFTSDVMMTLKVLGALAAVAITWMVHGLCRGAGLGRLPSLAAGLSIAASPLVGVPASSGLETIFLGFFMTASVALLMSSREWMKLAAAVGFAYCVSMRPEGLAIFVLVVFSFFLFKNSSLEDFGGAKYGKGSIFGSKKCLWLSIFGLFSAGFFIWQFNKYGSIFANTAQTKASGGLASHFNLARYKYLYDFFVYNGFYGFIMLVGFGAFLSSIWRTKKLVPAVTLAFIFSVPGFALSYIGREDYFPNFRYMMPYFPVFIFFSTFAITSYFQSAFVRKTFVYILVLIWALGLLTDIRTDSIWNNKNTFSVSPDRSGKDFSTFRKFTGSYWAPFPLQSDLFSLYAPQNGYVLYGNIGHPGMAASDVQILDTMGLVTSAFARLRSGKADGEEGVGLLISHYAPKILVTGKADERTKEVMSSYAGKNFVERSWLEGNSELVYLAADIVAEDGGSKTSPDVLIWRAREAYSKLSRDYYVAARFRDLLYVNQRVAELKSLMDELEKVRDFSYYLMSLNGVRALSDVEPRAPQDIPKVDTTFLAEKTISTVHLKDEPLLTFRVFHLRIKMEASRVLELNSELCSDAGCVDLAKQSVQTDSRGFAQVSFVFDRSKLLVPRATFPAVMNPEIFYAHLGLPSEMLPSERDVNRTIVSMPTDMPVSFTGQLRILISGRAAIQVIGVR